MLSLLEAKTEVIRLGQRLVAGLRERMGGLGRFDRTQRLHAAPAIIGVTAYFEALHRDPLLAARVSVTSRTAADDGGIEAAP